MIIYYKLKFMTILKFILGWMIWIMIFMLSLIYSFITWSWKETYTLDMERVMREVCGNTIWNYMFLRKKHNYGNKTENCRYY